MGQEHHDEDPIVEQLKTRNQVAIKKALATNNREGVCHSHEATVEVGVAGLQTAEMNFDMQRTTNAKLDTLDEKVTEIHEHRELSVKLLKAVVALLGALGGAGGLATVIQLVGCSQ